jgi:hypothetical protein
MYISFTDFHICTLYHLLCNRNVELHQHDRCEFMYYIGLIYLAVSVAYISEY